MITNNILNNTIYPFNQINSPIAIHEKYIPESNPSNLNLIMPNNNKTKSININDPPTFTFNRQYLPPVSNQFQENACTPFALTTMIQYYQNKYNFNFTPLSTESLYYWIREKSNNQNIDSGVYPEDALNTLKTKGISPEKDNNSSFQNEFIKPSKQAEKDALNFRIESWKQLFNYQDLYVNKSKIITESLVKGDVVYLAIYVNEEFIYPPISGIVDVDINKPFQYLAHGIVVVDYKTLDNGKRLFLCQNSWGKNYGIQPKGTDSRGYVWLTEEYVEKGCYFAGTIEFINIYYDYVNTVKIPIVT